MEITLPIGTKCMYIEWFKGSIDEQEMVLGRNMSLSIHATRKAIVNGHEKTILSCSILQKDFEKQNFSK